jgi:hypothetical protein
MGTPRAVPDSYIGPYEVTEKFGTVAYRIRLSDRLSAVHNVFHVSQLKKCEQILEAQIIEETNAEIESDLSLAEYPMRVLDHKERRTRRQKVKMYKIMESPHRRRSYMGDRAISKHQVPRHSSKPNP